MFKQIARFNALTNLAPISARSFHSSKIMFQSADFKKWAQLDVPEKQKFIRSFVDLFKEKNPCSKSNVMYKSLASGMEEYDDTPYVFGILYNEIRAVSLGESTDNTAGSGLMGDADFAKLLFSK